MRSTASPHPRLKGAIAHPVHAGGAPAPPGGRHRAPEVPGTVDHLTSEQIAAGLGPRLGTGKHAEPGWRREVFDPARVAVDAVDRLGVTAAQD